MASHDVEARPIRPPVARGDYTPPKPYVRPGADHSHITGHQERSSSMGKKYDDYLPEERRQAILHILQHASERTTPQLADELGVSNRKTLGNDLQRLRRDGLIEARPGFNNTSIWRAASTTTQDAAVTAATDSAADEEGGHPAGDTDETPSPEGEAPVLASGDADPLQLAPDERRHFVSTSEEDSNAGSSEHQGAATHRPPTPANGNSVDSVERIAIASDGCLLVFHSNGELSEFTAETAWAIRELIDNNRAMVMHARKHGART